MSKSSPPDNYVTPETTERAHTFGRLGGYHRKGRLSREQFLSAEVTPHPYPTSLYRAYCAGFREGRRQRDRKDAAWPPRAGAVIRAQIGDDWIDYEVLEITATTMLLRGSHRHPRLVFDLVDAAELHEQGLLEVGPSA